MRSRRSSPRRSAAAGATVRRSARSSARVRTRPSITTRQTTAGCGPGEVVVMDVGAACGGYAADVTRTIPVSGKFTPEQRAVYQIVRDAQAAAERVAGRAPRTRRGAIRRGRSWPAGVARLGLTEGRGRHVRPALGRPVPAGAGALHPGVSLHGPRARPRDRARGARHSASLEGHRELRAGRRLHHRARRLRQHPAARHPAGYAEEPGDDRARCGPPCERYDNIGVRIEDDYAITATGSSG